MYIGGEINDLVGTNFTDKHEEFGILGISNLIIIGIVLYLFAKKETLWSIEKSISKNQ